MNKIHLDPPKKTDWLLCAAVMFPLSWILIFVLAIFTAPQTQAKPEFYDCIAAELENALPPPVKPVIKPQHFIGVE